MCWPSAHGFAFFQRAREAFFASAERCSGVSFAIRAAPLILPPIRPCFRKYSKVSGDSFFFAIYLSVTRFGFFFNPLLLTPEEGFAYMIPGCGC
jgi:hypothetical protein